MADVLMVCVRQDVARAKALAEMFLSAGLSIGDAHASDAALRSSAAAILVWSHASVRSASFRDASRRAIRTGKALIVNLISPSSRPARIGCSPIFDLSRWGGAPDDAVLDPLRHAVGGMAKEFRTQVEHWRSIRHSDEASLFVDYLARYGLDAAFSDAAEQRLDEIAFGTLVGVRASSAQPEERAEDASVRGAAGRRGASAAAQANERSSPGGVAPCDEGVAPEAPVSKRRSRPPSSRSAKSPDKTRGREFAVGGQRAAMSHEALWSPRNQSAGRYEPSRSHIEDAPRVSNVERLAALEKAVRATVVNLALDLRKLQHWAFARFGSLRIAWLAIDPCRRVDARERKVVAAPGHMYDCMRRSVRAKHPSPPHRPASAPSRSAIEPAIGRYMALGSRIAQNPIAIASLVAAAALAGALYLTGGVSNVDRSDAGIAIEDGKTGQVVYFNEPESPESAAMPLSQPPLPAARRAGRGERTTTTSRSRSVVAASPISMSSIETSKSAASTDVSPVPSDAESLLSSGSLTMETFAFDLAPHLPQSAERGSATASTGSAFGSANAMGPPALGDAAIGDQVLVDGLVRSADLVLSAQESAYCPDAAGQVDTDLREPLTRGASRPNCIGR